MADSGQDRTATRLIAFPALALTNALPHPRGTLRPSIVITLSRAATSPTSTANVASCERTLAPSPSFRSSLAERCTVVSIAPHRGNTARSTPHPDETTHPAAGRRRFNHGPPAIHRIDIIHRPDGFAIHASHATLRRWPCAINWPPLITLRPPFQLHSISRIGCPRSGTARFNLESDHTTASFRRPSGESPAWVCA